MRELELCLASIERREALAARIALLSRRPRPWLRASRGGADRRGALRSALLALGALAVLRPRQKGPRRRCGADAASRAFGRAGAGDHPTAAARDFRRGNPSAGADQGDSGSDAWFLATERVAGSSAPRRSILVRRFQRRLLLAREAEAAADRLWFRPEFLADDGTPHLATLSATPTAPPLWTVGSPDPFAVANPHFGRGTRPFAARLALFDRSTDPLSPELRRHVAERPDKASSRRKSSRRYARRPPHFDPIASLLKVHRSIGHMVARLF